MGRDQIKDQLGGLIFGIAVSALVAGLNALAEALQAPNADVRDLLTVGFGASLATTMLRSVVTAVLTLLGTRIPGISGGRG